jgi:hypothetical protein
VGCFGFDSEAQSFPPSPTLRPLGKESREHVADGKSTNQPPCQNLRRAGGGRSCWPQGRGAPDEEGASMLAKRYKTLRSRKVAIRESRIAPPSIINCTLATNRVDRSRRRAEYDGFKQSCLKAPCFRNHPSGSELTFVTTNVSTGIRQSPDTLTRQGDRPRSALLGLRDDADIGLGRFPTLRITPFRFVVGDRPSDDHVLAWLPVDRGRRSCWPQDRGVFYVIHSIVPSVD